MGWYIGQEERKGRTLVADQAYRPGHVILELDPYEAVLYNEQASSRSHLTFKECDRCLRCGGCKQAWYANKEEQRAAWRAGHKEECRALAKCAPRSPPPSTRLAARVLWKHLRQQRAGEEAKGDTYADIMQLQDHWDKIDDTRKQRYAQMAVLTREYMRPSTREEHLPQARDIAHLLARFACNNHTICDEEQRAIGIGIYPTGALINHSCRPNAAQSFKGRRICFRAVQDIPRGGEVCISYVELAATRQERRQALLEGYFFDIDHKQPTGAAPVAKTKAAHVTASIFTSPTWDLDYVDEQLTALRNPDGGMFVGSGIAALWKPRALVEDGSFGMDADEEAEVGPQPPPSEAADEIVIQCWGPAFFQCGEAKENKAREAAMVFAALMQRHKAAEECMAAERAEEAYQHLRAPASDSPGRHTDWLALRPGIFNIWRMREQEVRMRAAIALELWQVALAAATQLTHFYRLVYPKVWPLLGLHYAATAKLAAVLEDNSRAAVSASEALQVLQFTHPDSRIIGDMLQIQHDARRQLDHG